MAASAHERSEFRRPLPVDAGQRELLFDWLRTAEIDGAPSNELAVYLQSDLDRFIYTLSLVPAHVHGAALEIGANPYFMSLLLDRLRPELQLQYVNYFGGGQSIIEQVVSWTDPSGERREKRFKSFNVDIECQRIPVEDATFEIVLLCEVLEHFIADPLKALLEVRRLLKPGGHLILTTPNVARFENVVALIEGRNIYDPYSAYGPHGRHNREYSRHELHQLLRRAGFESEIDFSSDVHASPAPAVDERAVVSLLTQIPNRMYDLGQYHFMRWRKAASTQDGLPRWLYRSYGAERYVD